MIRPADDLPHGREPVLLGSGTSLGTGGGALMSDAIRHDGVVYLSGRAAVDPATGELRATDFAGQLRIVLGDALAVLAQAGSGPEHVLRVECWLADRGDFTEWNAQYAEAFPAPRPARTTLVVAGFPVEGLLVEVQLTALVADG
jgi:2-iminobutanoate/2-iminopropanoate deaminase